MTWVHLIKAANARNPKDRIVTQDLFRHVRHHANDVNKYKINRFCKQSYVLLILIVILLSVSGYLIGLLIWWLPHA